MFSEDACADTVVVVTGDGAVFEAWYDWAERDAEAAGQLLGWTPLPRWQASEYAKEVAAAFDLLRREA